MIQRSTSPSEVVRRLLVGLLMVIVGVTWLAVGIYARSQRATESADDKAVLCSLIEEHGEDYTGELADCQHQLAQLRLMERH